MLEALEFFGDFAEPFRVALRVAARFVVANDREAFAERGGEVGERGIHRKSLKRPGVWRKRPL